MADDRYKWIALSNTTLGVLLATLDASITLIAMPDIFRGIAISVIEASSVAGRRAERRLRERDPLVTVVGHQSSV